MFTEPLYSKSQVKRAGRAIIAEDISEDDRERAREIVNNWRSAHAWPLNTLQMSLRRKAKSVSESALVAQRLKRLPSIERKLERLRHISLTSMQDLGGCRAVMDDVPQVRAVVEKFLSSKHKHKLVDYDDYITNPKDSGYRSVHLVYEYYSDKNATWNGLKVEVQVRSKLQHAWATAVETIGLFNRQALKAGEGDPRWLRLLALMGSEMADLEGARPVHGDPSVQDKRRHELSGLANELDVLNRLSGYASGLQIMEAQAEQGAKFFLLTLDTSTSELSILGYEDRTRAATAYDISEANLHDEVDIVLVSVDSVTALQAAYPNYFADTSLFARTLQAAVGA